MKSFLWCTNSMLKYQIGNYERHLRCVCVYFSLSFYQMTWYFSESIVCIFGCGLPRIFWMLDCVIFNHCQYSLNYDHFRTPVSKKTSCLTIIIAAVCHTTKNGPLLKIKNCSFAWTCFQFLFIWCLLANFFLRKLPVIRHFHWFHDILFKQSRLHLIVVFI